MLGKGFRSKNSDDDTSPATSRATTPEQTQADERSTISNTVVPSTSANTVDSKVTDATLNNQQKPLSNKSNNDSR